MKIYIKSSDDIITTKEELENKILFIVNNNPDHKYIYEKPQDNRDESLGNLTPTSNNLVAGLVYINLEENKTDLSYIVYLNLRLVSRAHIPHIIKVNLNNIGKYRKAFGIKPNYLFNIFDELNKIQFNLN